MKNFTLPLLAITALLATSGCTSVAQGKSTFTVQCQSVLGIGCGWEDAEEAIPAGGKVTNVNHTGMLFNLIKTSTIGGTK